ncbi:hypothetical protein DL546_002480 [Coniochaeta pulveracea]|uniref:Peptidase A1 domain-containing protein n=1 Tax=Coniochaeta pulveracea TaxID=177199 RepID=A0A420Y5S3_9PEZI|nr:hypothetical protein DL546_002480 [Coniochaeta pulveracea]
MASVCHRQTTKPLKPLTKRDQDVPLFNVTSISYLVELSIGTPGQSVKVAIDTGSDELWVNPDCTDENLTTSQQQECSQDGTYKPKSSTSAKRVKDELGNYESSSIQYGKGAVEMNYYTDNVALPESSLNVTALQFGVANQTEDLNEGILGLGWGYGKNLAYNNLLDQLVAQNAISTKAISIGLGDVDEKNAGTLLFGAIDTKKFSGSLISNPILGPQGGETLNRYWVQMTSVALNKSSKTKTYAGGNTPVVLDSGSSLSYLPDTIVSGMAEDLDAQYDRSSQLYIVDCSVRSQQGTFDFTFGQAVIRVPFDEFIWAYDDQTCILGAVATDSSSGITALLGDTFMRSAFVVFDQTNEKISLAQYVNCGENEQAIPASGALHFTGECDAPSFAPAVTGSGNSSSSSSGNDSDNAAGRNTFGVAGFCVAAFAGLMLAL